jgi:hypothetical protein
MFIHTNLFFLSDSEFKLFCSLLPSFEMKIFELIYIFINIITKKDIGKGLEFIQFFFTLFKESPSVSLALNNIINKTPYSHEITSDKMIEEIENAINLLNQNLSFNFTKSDFKTKKSNNINYSEIFLLMDCST